MQRIRNIDDWQSLFPLSLQTLDEMQMTRPTLTRITDNNERAIETQLSLRLRLLRARELSEYRHGPRD